MTELIETYKEFWLLVVVTVASMIAGVQPTHAEPRRLIVYFFVNLSIVLLVYTVSDYFNLSTMLSLSIAFFAGRFSYFIDSAFIGGLKQLPNYLKDWKWRM